MKFFMEANWVCMCVSVCTHIHIYVCMHVLPSSDVWESVFKHAQQRCMAASLLGLTVPMQPRHGDRCIY